MRIAVERRGFARLGLHYATAVLVVAGQVSAQDGGERPAGVAIDDDGTVHVPAHAVPMSAFLSAEGQAYVTEHLQNMLRPELLVQDGGVPPLLAGYLARQREVFAVERREVTIGGVRAYDYVPKDGIAERNRDRVLVNLHGGGFSGCWPGCAELESIPVAALGRIRVVSLDYRQGPEHKFPAASEDVAAAYRELLEIYRAENIGLYGCSAGGMLAGMAVAWFQQHSLPSPGAIGVLCAGMTLAANGFGGDAAYTTAAIGESRSPPLLPARVSGGAPTRSPLGYLAGVRLDDPLAAPASSPEVLAKFPPTLIVTGTRGFELSSAVHTHALLVKQGVEADLHVWEGMFHGFFYNVDVPESRDCYDVIVKFFERHLGRH
ncbi:MAG TPA: alpha/beta hydrolase fold domain-containing protein [Gammaproteobacteria bacterium]|nr:alpha/beta hydrolase fold domain-containing protein [Gammaproteobacteria bacterium]